MCVLFYLCVSVKILFYHLIIIKRYIITHKIRPQGDSNDSIKIHTLLYFFYDKNNLFLRHVNLRTTRFALPT